MSKMWWLTAVLSLCLVRQADAQRSDSLSRPENLVTDGMPPIPASIAEEVRRYTEYRSATLADWHPTRREALILTRFANTPQVHRVRFPGGARTQLTFFDEPISYASYATRKEG